MPLYEYTCPKCGTEFEELTRAADADKIACPKCRTRARRKFSTFGVATAQARSSSEPACPSCPTCPTAAGGACPYS